MGHEATGTKYVCPRCGAESIQLFSMAFQSGTSKSTSTTTGVGVGSGGLGTFGAVTASSQATLLAGQVAPPEPLKTTLWVVITVVGTMVAIACLSSVFNKGGSDSFPMLILGISGALYGGWRLKKCKKWNEEEFPRLMAEWERSWVCHKCGNTFQLP